MAQTPTTYYWFGPTGRDSCIPIGARASPSVVRFPRHGPSRYPLPVRPACRAELCASVAPASAASACCASIPTDRQKYRALLSRNILPRIVLFLFAWSRFGQYGHAACLPVQLKCCLTSAGLACRKPGGRSAARARITLRRHRKISIFLRSGISELDCESCDQRLLPIRSKSGDRVVQC
jgi:hypothetical protein